MFADYSAEAKMIDGKIPVLNVLSDTDGWTEPAKAWLAGSYWIDGDAPGHRRRDELAPRRSDENAEPCRVGGV
jgi:hypothetical protein